MPAEFEKRSATHNATRNKSDLHVVRRNCCGKDNKFTRNVPTQCSSGAE